MEIFIIGIAAFFAAIVSTKIHILVADCFWMMAHASRTDFAMTMLLICLIIYGAGKLSFDFIMLRKLKDSVSKSASLR